MLHHPLIVLATAAFGPAPAQSGPMVTVNVATEAVCASERRQAYLNFDFLVENATAEDAAIGAVRATVLDPSGTAIERRVVWQGALALLGLGPNAAIAAGTSRLAFNPVLLGSAALGTTIRYEFDVAGGAEPQVVEIAPVSCRPAAPLAMPLDGRVLVLDGHDVLSHHRRFDYRAPWAVREGLTDNSQRFALDLLVVDEAGRTHRGAGRRNADFFGWGQPVRAPAAGAVVAAHDGQPDNDEVGSENMWTERSWATAPGNHVVIRHADGTFTLMSHLQRGSVRVRPGDTIAAGEIVGAVGNSGSSLMPHLHFQRQTGSGTAGVGGLPAWFGDVVLASGEPVPAHGIVLDSGDIVLPR